MGEIAEDLVYQVVLVYQGQRPEELIKAIKLHECSLITIELATADSMDAIRVRASCVVYDWRITYVTSARFIASRRYGQSVPQLIFHENRPGWEPGSLMGLHGPIGRLVDVAVCNVYDTVADFMGGIGIPRK